MATSTAIHPSASPYFQYDDDASPFRDTVAHPSHSPRPSPYASSDSISGCAITPDIFVDSNPFADQPILDRETGGQFVLGHNYPNPYAGETTVPFTLFNAADVQLTIYDPLSRKVAGVVRKGMAPGEHQITLNFRGLEFPKANIFTSFR